ncbi:DUF5957 family protein [Nocardiopsis potens]|uniref:DUF5957 family protein n=1 Tax=Nocardiopsis potens TaxID=1246458 RepID=UPI000345E140|nr:DUF5957 family protein [Nocardiopsis potens]
MKILGAAVAGLFGGWLLGFLLSSAVRILLHYTGIGSDGIGVAVAAGPAPYATALIGAVAVPVIAAKRPEESGGR